MNLYVADPEWGWWIIGYFFLGGIAAGAFFLSALIELFGTVEDEPLSRAGYRVAFPLIVVCGAFLTLDLNRPERFWHMLLQSEVVQQAFAESWWLLLTAPMLKPWSPMSIGSWALTLFGAFSLPAFLASVWPGGRVARWLKRRWLRGLFLVLGSGVGFFVASYTGVLLTATSQPLWSQTDWLGPLFLTSAASTGLATMTLLRSQHQVREETEKLERAERWVLGLELVVFVFFLASVAGSWLVLWETFAGKVLLLGPLVLGLLLPLALQSGWLRARRWRVPVAAILVLVGGLLLRWAVVQTPPELLAQRGDGNAPLPIGSAVGWFSLSPEEGRPRGGGVGASGLNRAQPLTPRTKIPEMVQP